MWEQGLLQQLTALGIEGPCAGQGGWVQQDAQHVRPDIKQAAAAAAAPASQAAVVDVVNAPVIGCLLLAVLQLKLKCDWLHPWQGANGARCSTSAQALSWGLLACIELRRPRLTSTITHAAAAAAVRVCPLGDAVDSGPSAH